jgi:hypothetical protein
MAREWSTNELYRYQLTGEKPKDEVQAVQADAKAKAKTETKPKSVDVQPTDKA